MKGKGDGLMEVIIGQIYIDALDPSRSISSRQARELTRRLCAGYKALGLKEGDCVCTISFNDVRRSKFHLLSYYTSCLLKSKSQN